MKKSGSLSAVLLALLFCLFASCAQAVQAAEGGLSVSLRVDRTSCAEGETLRADVALRNDGGTVYEDVSIALDCPASLVPQDGTQALRAIAAIAPGQQADASAVLIAVPDPTRPGQPSSLPATGDDEHPALWLLLFALSAAGLARLGRKARGQLLALLLCAAVLLPAAPCAQAAPDGRSDGWVVLRVTQSVHVMGQEAELTAVVRCRPAPAGKNPSTLRALYVIEEEFPGGYSSFPNEYKNNTALLESMFAKAGPSGLLLDTAYAYRNQTQEELLARIAALADMQDENDVSFFYLTCHGVFDETEKVYTNEVYLSDGSRMHISALADALAAIPGRVIVVLDYCGSGLAIGRSAAPAAGDAYDRFARQALAAFAAVDAPASAQKRSAQRDGSLLEDGKFCVITGASGTQSSWTNTLHGSYLLQWMNSGVMDADSSRDGTVTLREMGLYLQEQGRMKSFYEYGGVVHMIPQFYPETSSYPLFTR